MKTKFYPIYRDFKCISYLKSIHKILFIIFSFIALNTHAQFSVTTAPPLTGGNGSNGVTFQLETNSSIILDTIWNAFYGSGHTEVWYRPGGMLLPISTANGWIQLGTTNITALQTSLTIFTIQPVLTNINLFIPGGSVYGMYVGSGASTGSSTIYSTWSAANQDVFTDGRITIKTGQNIGYGGIIPNPTNHPRQFNGKISYKLNSEPIDLYPLQVLSPNQGCGLTENNNITIRIMNLGTNTLPSGQAIPLSYQINNDPPVNETLTLGGNFPSLAMINYTFNTKADLSDSGSYEIKIWTSLTGDGNIQNDTITVKIENTLVQKFTWIENFEKLSTNIGGGWSTPASSKHPWSVGQGQTPTADTGPFHDFNPGSFTGNYIFMEANTGVSGDEFIIRSPCFPIKDLTSPGINFAYHMYGTGIGSLHFDVIVNDSIYNSFWQETGNQGNAWHEVAIDLTQFKANDFIQVQFRGRKGSTVIGDIALDDIRIGNIPSLSFPSVINDCGFVRLNAGNVGASYNWSTGDTTRMIEIISGATTINTNVSLIITAQNGMKNYANIELNIEPGPYVFLGNDTVICDQPSFTMDAGNPGASYEWDNGNLNRTRTINSSGNFFVEVNHLGCYKSDTIDVIMESTPVATFSYIDNPNNGVTVFNSAGSVGNNYKWFFGDGHGSNVANPTHNYTSPADSFMVMLIVSNACGSDTLRQAVSNITGIEDLYSITAADVYPNPSNGKFTIEVETAKAMDIELTVFNMQGQLIAIEQFEKVSKLSNELNLSSEAKGVYYLKIKAGDEVTVKKLVIQ